MYFIPRLITTLILIAVVSASCTMTDESHYPHNNGTTIATDDGSGPRRISDIKNRRYGSPIKIVSTTLASDGVNEYMNQQRQEMERELAEEIRSRSIFLQLLEDQTLHLRLPTQDFFDMYSANIQADYRSSLTRVLSIIEKFDKTAIHIIGYTDNTGTENYNRILSQRQANAVADFLNGHGVDNTRLRVEGRGEDSPLVSNDTKEGREHNRRIELFLKPIVAGNVDWAFTRPN